MKKILFIMLAVVLALSVGLIGCNGGQQEEEEEEEEEEVITLVFSCPFLEVEPPGVIANYFMDLVEQNTDGRVEFDRYFAEALAEHTEHIQLLNTGEVDFIMVVPVYMQELVLNQLCDFPMYCSLEESLEGVHELTMEIPETKAIFEEEQENLNIKILHWVACGSMELLCRNNVTSLTELSGQKVNLFSPADVDVWGEFDMVAVPVYIADFYESLSRGVVDCIFLTAGGFLAMNLFEVAQSNLTLGQGGADTPIIFNLDTWNGLPSEIQDVIMQASLETSQWSVGFSQGVADQAHQLFTDAGLYVGAAPEEDALKLFEALMKYTAEETWMGQCNAAGVGEEAQVLIEYWRDAAYGNL